VTLSSLPPQYKLRLGSPNDKSNLTKFIVEAYKELFPIYSDFSHLKTTVEQYLSKQTPIFWVDHGTTPIACLWLGSAMDQMQGLHYAYIFLLYVQSAHRRQGIGKYLLEKAEEKAQQRGDQQIGLQVFLNNLPALDLYQKLGYQSQSYLMIKKL
jgi:ribosomal protein S18 acetylase RimI-like enzyme